MSRISQADYVCAVIHVNGLYLILRERRPAERPTQGYFFPGGKWNEKYPADEYLKAQIYKKYGLEVNVETFMGGATIFNGHAVTTLNAYYCALKNKPKLDKKIIDYRWVKAEEILGFYLEPEDRLIAERLYHFHKVYDAEIRLNARNQKETNEAWFYFDSLVYFGPRVAMKDVKDFNELVRTDATIEAIRSAYKWVLVQNHLDYNEYLDYRSYREKAAKGAFPAK